jgi:acyl carrier protein
MTRDEIVATVNGILTEEFEISADSLTPEAKLAEDLELDSLDGVDLVVSLEKAFGCRIKEEDARQMRELKQIYDYIESAASEAS